MEAAVGDAGGQLFIAVKEIDESGQRVPVDITDARLVRLDVTREDGTTEQWVGEISAPDTILYTVPPGKFPKKETIMLRAYVEWSNSTFFHSLEQIPINVG